MNNFLSTILEGSSNEEELELFRVDSLYESVTEEMNVSVTPQQVRIIKTGVNEYALTMDELCKVQEYFTENGFIYNETETLNKICEANGIQMEQVTVVIPSKEEFEAFIEACKSEACAAKEACKSEGCGSKCETEAGIAAKCKKKIKKAKDKVSNLKCNGVKLVKAKSK